MRKMAYFCIALALSFMLTSVSHAAKGTEVSTSAKVKKAGKALFNYPANVVKESVDVVADTGKKGTAVVTKATKRTGEVVTGDVAKTKELVTEPLVGTAETGKSAVEETAKIPAKAAEGVTE